MAVDIFKFFNIDFDTLKVQLIFIAFQNVEGGRLFEIRYVHQEN